MGISQFPVIGRGRARPFMIVDLRSKIVFQAREGDSESTLPAPLNRVDNRAFVIAESVQKMSAVSAPVHVVLCTLYLEHRF